MKRNTRRRWIGLLSLGLIAVAAIVAALVVFAGTNDTQFTATGYSDVIRFQANGVATLQVKVFDLAGKVIWDSGVVSGDTIDWDRNNDLGERLAYGAYIYNAQGWNASGDLILQKNGKLALMPGDKVQLQQAPARIVDSSLPAETLDVSLQPKTVVSDSMYVTGIISTTNTGSNNGQLTVETGPSGPTAMFTLRGHASANNGDYFSFAMATDIPDTRCYVKDVSTGTFHSLYSFAYLENTINWVNNKMVNVGTVGIGTPNPTAKLTIQATSGDLIAAYNSSDRVFVVKSTGEVRADGAYYGASFNTGSADVAERINTSEWVEPGNVVEIDPEHTGFFRKSSSPYSRKVAGIISTSPGVILGNTTSKEATGDWKDNRPVLAVTGRVPCMVSAENGAIQIGDLLVASSTPGVAMKADPNKAMGAVVGKAMEPLKEGEGTIVVQVMLR